MSDYVEISAKAAHDVASRVNNNIIEELKGAIMDKIQDARIKGEFDIQIRLEGNLYDMLNKKRIRAEIDGYLNGLGYAVYEDEDYKTTILTISWADVDED